MKVSELKALLNRPGRHDDDEVMIAIKLPYPTIGPIPMMKLHSANPGFDWEKGKYILRPESPLTPFKAEE